MICYFSTKTGNTQRFVETLDVNIPKYKIEKKKDLFLAKNKFILFVATYCNSEGKNAIPKQVIEFIKINHENMTGVVASGNKNFGKLYGVSGDIISRNCKVPLFHKYELFGTPTDIQVVEDLIKKLKL